MRQEAFFPETPGADRGVTRTSGPRRGHSQAGRAQVVGAPTQSHVTVPRRSTSNNFRDGERAPSYQLETLSEDSERKALFQLPATGPNLGPRQTGYPG